MSTTPNDPGGYGGGSYGGAPSYGSTGGASQSNPLAIVALITGILSILTCLFWFVSDPLGIAAIITGVLGGNKVKQGLAGQGGLARAGLITGIVGIVLTIAVVILAFAGMSFLGDRATDIEACQTLPVEEQQACVEDAIGG